MLDWLPQTPRVKRLYRCAHCDNLTTAPESAAAVRLTVSASVVTAKVRAFRCSHCGNETCFDGDRQIPSPRTRSQCFPIPTDYARSGVRH